MRRYLLSAALAGVWTVIGASFSPAANVYWDDAGGSASKLWSDFGNWNPDGTVSGDVVSIGVDTLGANVAAAANDRTLFDGGIQVFGLTVGNGADVVNSTDDGATNAHELIVNGATTVGGAGSSIIVYGTAFDGFDTDTLTINDGGLFTLNSQTAQGTAILEVDTGLLDNNTGGHLNGNGRIELEATAATPGVAFTALSNDGQISAGHLGLAIFAPPARMLQITAVSPDARFDWDGAIGNGVLNVNGNATLDVDVSTGTDAFGGTMNLSTGATLDMAQSWSMDLGTINANTPAFGLIIIGQDPNPGPAARIAGANWTMSGGTINVDDSWDSLQFDSQVVATGGTINNEGTLIFNGGATLLSGVDFNMVGDGASLAVNSALNIDTPDFNLDGNEAAGNVTTINAGGNLDLDLGAGADLSWGHTINMNGGELDVTTSAATAWSLNSSGVLTAAGGITSTINSVSETFQIQGDVNVTGNSRLVVNSLSDYASTANVAIEAGSILDHGTATYNGGSFTGGGTLRKGLATINVDTTWNVATVDLDDGNTTLNANLTINADAIDDGGDGLDLLVVVNDPNMLTVNINGGGGWAIDSPGQITYNGNATPNSYLAGSDIGMNGTLNHSGDGRSDARMVIGSTGVVNVNTAGEPFRLNGGDTLLNPNRIAGGTITGVGILGADSGSALHGFGIINTDVDFDANANLRADNGTLTLNGAILDANVVGTADDDGVLEVTNAWNTNTVGAVDLDGGELRGATITNDGANGINGDGRIAARVINNTRIDAQNGGTLVVETTGNNNDWDGAANTGQLNAGTGNLEIRDDASFLFQGSVFVGVGRTVFANGFELEFDPGSNLDLTSGTYRSTHATDIGGSVNVAGGSASTIANDVSLTFENGSSTTLGNDLRLESPVTTIEVGATFAGGGALANPTDRTLRILDGVASGDLAVLVQNEGTLQLGPSAGQAQGTDYEQTASGTWIVDLGGTGINDFDRLNLTGASQLDGILELSLIGGYVPALGDTLNILSAAGGVGGTFASLIQPATMPAGLAFDVIYNPTLVQLSVINAPTPLVGDYNLDGSVDAADYTVWRDSLGQAGAGLAADGDADGMVDSDDYDLWKDHFGMMAGAGASTLAASAVPEPATFVLFVLALAMLSSGRRRFAD